MPAPNPHYWIEDVTLTTANSLTRFSAPNRSTPRAKSLFLVGNTVPPNADFPSLPQASAEMRDIEKYFPAQRRDVLSGNEATPAAYLSSKPEKYAFLHFVTHGTASRARPLESAVILSKDQDDDSYKLHAEIWSSAAFRLSRHHLACNGAESARIREGLAGLSWAFLRAAAPTSSAHSGKSTIIIPQFMTRSTTVLATARIPPRPSAPQNFRSCIQTALPEALLLGALPALRRFLTHPSTPA